MDFNYLYHHQQLSLMHADRALNGPARVAHEGQARHFGALIARGKAERRSARLNRGLTG